MSHKKIKNESQHHHVEWTKYFEISRAQMFDNKKAIKGKGGAVPVIKNSLSFYFSLSLSFPYYLPAQLQIVILEVWHS